MQFRTKPSKSESCINSC
uniref:Uncharacterized protein n=1 Tax=Arundo donax TaxID=35708 RepID=A0A0A9EL93_ARUDO